MGDESVFTFRMPDIGEGVVEGEVVEWLKQVGDTVKQDEPVVVLMTDKATVELPAPYPGVIEKQYYKAGEIAIKDHPLYDIRTSKSLQPEKNLELKPTSVAVIEPVSQQKRNESNKVLATPKVRHLAKQLAIDIETVSGSGKDGRVMLEDLKGNLPNVTYSPLIISEEDTKKPLTGVRGLMARRMDQHQIPQFSYFESVEVTRLIQLRQSVMKKAAKENIHLSYMPFFIRALALTTRQFPILNSSVDMQEGCIVYHQQLNVGIATATPQGLIVPVIKSVEGMGMEEVIHAYEFLKAQVLSRKTSSEMMKGATITISNFGVLGGEGMWATPLISSPEVAILAIARIRKDPVVRNQEVVVRDILPLSWSFDHRIIDGELAAKISHHFATLLRDPAVL